MKRFVLGAVVGLALASGVAYATIPDGAGVIHACMLKNIGTIRIIDPSAGQKCNTSLETPIDWNQKGSVGVRGPTGSAGANGVQGPAGPKGEPGKDGSAGTNGTRGATGARGPTGTNGTRGPTGTQGPKGVTGARGPTGPPGASGSGNGLNWKGEYGLGLGYSVGDVVELDGSSFVAIATVPACTLGPHGGGSCTPIIPPDPAYWSLVVSKGDPGSADAWSQTGNAGMINGTNFLGTTDNVALDFKVNNSRALRLQPSPFPSPNIIGGGSTNTVDSTLGGSTIAGGETNTVTGNGVFSAILGGSQNTASGTHSTVTGGAGNTASGTVASVLGGQSNTADGYEATVVGGDNNQASGDEGIVAGGESNIASGIDSFAGGDRARATHNGSFVWADRTFHDFGSTAAGEFAVRATGGVRFVSAIDASGNPTAGVSLAVGGGSWSSLSDRAAKAHLAAVDGRNLLDRLAGISIFSWNYKAQKPSIRHVGPMAQDFYRAFGVGEDNRHIDTIDSEGVALAGIQSLYKLELKQQRQLKAQQRELAALKSQVAKLKGANR